jgi:hypothetical protein
MPIVPALGLLVICAIASRAYQYNARNLEAPSLLKIREILRFKC